MNGITAWLYYMPVVSMWFPGAKTFKDVLLVSRAPDLNSVRRKLVSSSPSKSGGILCFYVHGVGFHMYMGWGFICVYSYML